MQHKGINYSVVMTANPTGWRWTVELLPPLRPRTGEALTRAVAVRQALATIDKLIIAPRLSPVTAAPGVPHSQNLLLASLSSEDLALILPHLKVARFEQHEVLFDCGSEVNSSYFPTTAIISLVMGLQDGETVETAMVGCDGVVSASAALDGKISLSKGVVQLAGEALVCKASDLKSVAMESDTFFSTLIRHEQSLFAQAQQSAACLANHNVEARLCRWLLRARDLARSDTLPFTQEYLAEMLGASRPSVTTVAHTLQRAGMIQYSRGKIQIVNGEALQEAACECYEAVKMHHLQLLGHNQRPSS